MFRAPAVWLSALIGLGLVSAVASARRGLVVPAAVDTGLELDEDSRVLAAGGSAIALATAEQGEPFLKLPAIRIVNVNTRRVFEGRLYDAHGRLDESALSALDALFCDARDPDNVRTRQLDRRVIKLLYRAAYHFGSKSVQVISGYREPGSRSEGRHGEGRALDFRLTNVSASALAGYLRKTPKVGVGVYTNPATQYVHLDDRDKSYHWLDASPPKRRWRERPIGGAAMTSRDASYVPMGDWPEGTRPSPVALAAHADGADDEVVGP